MTNGRKIVYEFIQSFTEPDVILYKLPEQHSAYILRVDIDIENDIPVFGGSTFKKFFVKPFDKYMMSNILAKKWKVRPQSILELWAGKGKSTALFGSAVHKIIEDYLNGEQLDHLDLLQAMNQTRLIYLSLLQIGDTIYRNSGKDENYAKPTNKDIRNLMKASNDEIEKYSEKILSEFIDILKKHNLDKYKILPEVYVTYSPYNMGGSIDGLIITDEENKKCIVADWKVQEELDTPSRNNTLLNELKKSNATKLDIIRIQLSYYAFMLREAGWEVEKGVVLGRNGKWEYYEVELIPHNQMRKLLTKYLKIK